MTGEIALALICFCISLLLIIDLATTRKQRTPPIAGPLITKADYFDAILSIRGVNEVVLISYPGILFVVVRVRWKSQRQRVIASIMRVLTDRGPAIDIQYNLTVL